MNQQEFVELVQDEPALQQSVSRAGKTMQPQDFSGAAEVAAIMLMFPVVKYMLTNIGLPWLHEIGRFSELNRQRIGRWIDEQYEQHGLDPVKAKEASQVLIAELEGTTDMETKTLWKVLAERLQAEANTSDE